MEEGTDLRVCFGPILTFEDPFLSTLPCVSSGPPSKETLSVSVTEAEGGGRREGEGFGGGGFPPTHLFPHLSSSLTEWVTPLPFTEDWRLRSGPVGRRLYPVCPSPSPPPPKLSPPHRPPL